MILPNPVQIRIVYCLAFIDLFGFSVGWIRFIHSFILPYLPRFHVSFWLSRILVYLFYVCPCPS